MSLNKRIGSILVLFGAMLLCQSVFAQGLPDPVCAALSDQAKFSANDARVQATFEGRQGLYSSPRELQEEYTAPPIGRLRSIVDAFADQGIALVIVAIPQRPLVYPENMPDGAWTDESLQASQVAYGELNSALRQAGALAPNVLEVFLQSKEQGALHFRTDHHWTPLGAKVVAQEVAALLLTSGAVRLGSTAFEDLPVETETFVGSFAAAVEKVCPGVDLGDESFQRVQSVPLPSDAVGLFDDVDLVDGVLVGTSFSKKRNADYFNFAGEIGKGVGSEVLDAAINGGGTYSSLLQYLVSPEYAEHKPKFIVWEIGNSFSPLTDDLTSQIVASIRGTCVESPFAEVRAQADESVLIDVSAIEETDRSRAYLDIDMDDDSVRRIIVHFDGDQPVTFRPSLPGQMTTTGRFLLSLPDSGVPSSIRVAPENNHQPFTVRLCGIPGRTSGTAHTVAGLPAAEPAPSGSTGALLHITVSGQQFDGSPILIVDPVGQPATSFPITAVLGEGWQELEVPIAAAADTLRFRMTNDLNMGLGKDRNIIIESMTIDGRVIDLAALPSDRLRATRITAEGHLKLLSSGWVTVPGALLWPGSENLSCSSLAAVIGPFQSGVASLDSNALRQLQDFIDLVQTAKCSTVKLVGFSTRDGDYDLNLRLAAERAETVSDVIKRAGISNIEFGAHDILASSDTAGPRVAVFAK